MKIVRVVSQTRHAKLRVAIAINNAMKKSSSVSSGGQIFLQIDGKNDANNGDRDDYPHKFLEIGREDRGKT
jgi:hypothetical protein